MSLTQAQYEAATAIEGPLLIIAGAGTGKTRTLVYRVAHLIDQGVDPRSILLLTFTRRAAEEMLRRASLLIDSRCSQVAGGTFHSFANLVLRKSGRHIDLSPSFTIMDRPDSEDVIQLIRTDMGLNHQRKTLSAQTDGGGDLQHDAQQANAAQRFARAGISPSGRRQFRARRVCTPLYRL